MKLIFQFSILLFLLNACSTTQPFITTKENIKVVKHQQHPFLIDHSKKIVVIKNKKILFELETYADPGSGCRSYLFEERDYFVIIECNGMRYHIEKKDGKITKDKWTWMEPLPLHYIGTFVRSTDEEYQLIDKAPKELEEVYIFKDPG